MTAMSTGGRCVLALACGGLIWASAVSCARDERDLQLLAPGSPAGGPTTETGMLLGALLEVRPPAVDLGAVATGFASRARLSVVNAGNAPLSAPGVAWAAGNSSDYEIIQNQCTLDLAPGQSCELRVQFVPSQAGAAAAALEIFGGPGDPLRVPFSGEGFPAGNLILAPAVGSFEDYGGLRVGSQRESTFSLMNAGSAPSGVLSLRVNRPEFSLLPAQPGECQPGLTDLAPSQLCNLRVAFTAAERGPAEATLTAITPGAGSGSLNLLGTGLVAGVLETSNSTVDFAGVVLGSSGFSSIQFQNQGDEPLVLAGARLEPADVAEFSIQNSSCGAGTLLAPGTSCEVGLEFRPTVEAEERSAELVVETDGAEPLRVGLVGRGLGKGTLVVAASTTGEEDFGDVLLEQGSSRVFLVSNPGTQPSGVLSLATSGSFELGAPELGDCLEGETSLVNGESCTVHVSFKPTLRQPEAGALTISSALAGATRLDLKGRGILPATFDMSKEVNFGRVLTNASAERTITLKNAGDVPLEPPSVEVTSSAPNQAEAFRVDNGCSAPLAFGEQCGLTVTFDPTDAVPHSANLVLTSASGTSNVLLLGEALTPGSLVLAAAGGGADFGDVPLGTTVNRSFTLSNPGDLASGRLTISSDDSHFLVNLGDCNQGPQEGLVDGSGCTFSVAFTPDSSDPLVANLSVQSPGAGRAGLQIRGRGRSRAVLAATGNRDLGRANIGRPPTAANQFTWTVNNNGDLASGALRVTRGSVTEFQISADTCSNAPIAGHSSCTMQIGFVPAEPPGARTESIVVTDSATNRTVTLVLTATSVRVANPGQSCINAECASGVCTDGVCCDRACDRTCQQCSATGVCADQSAQQQCGNGAARCFGVDQCLLPTGQACGADSDCGGGALCKQCQGGGRQCTAPNVCCGGCPGNQACTNGSCGCSAQQIDCGGGLCIPRNTANVCCPSAPQCPTNLPACTNDGRCVQCTAGNSAACGPCATCNATTNTCTPRPRGTTGVCPQAGQVCDGAGACFAPACGLASSPACGTCRTCQDFTCRNANQGTNCGAGPSECSNQDTCNAQGQCQANDRTGSCTSQPAGSCSGGQCAACNGCAIGTTCVANGTVNTANACQICDTARSRTAFSIRNGANCGSGPSECSNQDTCNAQGQCQANDRTGSCTSQPGGSCSGGQCVGCNGCAIGGICRANNFVNPDNSCQICDTTRSVTGFSPRTGANCGAGRTECSDQDTCNAQGQCQPNDRQPDSNCTAANGAAGTCQNLQCVASDTFDCVAPDPPTVASNIPTNNVFVIPGATPPVARGGTIRNGRYVPTRIDVFGNLPFDSVFIPTYEFSGRSVQIAETGFTNLSPISGFLLVDVRFAGTFTTNGTSMTFDVDRCDPQFSIDLQTQTVQFTATADGLTTISQQGLGPVVVRYSLQ
jgi:hypothetical protein